MSEPPPSRTEYERLRKLAHEAPMNPRLRDHKGREWIDCRSRAYADRANEMLAVWLKMNATPAENQQ